jgi:hypothetical protein
MQDGSSVKPQSHKTDAEQDRTFQVLALEYGTLREEILMRASARYQFIGFITAAAALIGAGISYSAGPKTWLLVALAMAVIGVGVYGYYRMRYHVIRISARIAEIENRINKLVPAEPGTPSLLSWESDHQGQLVFGRLSLGYRWFKLHIHPAKEG